MKIDASLTFNSFRFDQDSDAHLVLTITAPEKVGEQKRSPICVVTVLDNSGSMQGLKMERAKESCLKLIENLCPGDYYGFITFDTNVVVHVTPQKVTAENKAKFSAAVRKISARGSTNFAGGMLEAIKLVDALDLPTEVLCRVIMITDGQPNVGIVTKPAQILKLLSDESRISVSAFGFGDDAAQDFLSDLSQKGNGSYSYVSEPDSILAALGKELGGLLSTVATNLVIEVKANYEHQVTSVVSDIPHEIEVIGGETTLRANNIYAEEVRHLVLAVKLKEQKQAWPRQVNAFDVCVGYDTLDDNGKCVRSTLSTKAKVSFVKAGEEQQTPDSTLNGIVELARLTRLQIEADAAAKVGNFDQANEILRGFRSNDSSLNHVVQNITDAYVNPAAYAASTGYLNSMRRGMTRGMTLGSADSRAQKDLIGARVSLSNSYQTTTSASFTEPKYDLGDASLQNPNLVVAPTSPKPSK